MLSCASLVSVGYAPAITPPASSRRHATAKLSDEAPPKVVVTGISALTSLSSDCSAHTFFDNLIAGKCGIGPLTRFDTTNHAVKIGAQIHDFDVEDGVVRRRWGRPKGEGIFRNSFRIIGAGCSGCRSA
mgnify:CR=1 FL=1